jgi:hypothetical protein
MGGSSSWHDGHACMEQEMFWTNGRFIMNNTFNVFLFYFRGHSYSLLHIFVHLVA